MEAEGDKYEASDERLPGHDWFLMAAAMCGLSMVIMALLWFVL